MQVNFDELATLRHQHSDERIAYASGCFDLLHIGHLIFLQRLRSLGQISIVGITPDDKIAQRKGTDRPIIPETQRAKLVDALTDVDYTLITPASSPEYQLVGQAVVAELRPDTLLVSASDTGWENDRQWLRGLNVDLIMDHSRSGEISTTAIIERIRQQDQIAETTD